MSGRPATGRFSRRSFFFTGDVPAGIDAMFSRSLLFGCCGASRAQPAHFLIFVVFCFWFRTLFFLPWVRLHQWGCPNIVRLVPARFAVGQLFSKRFVFCPQGYCCLPAAASLLRIGKFVLQLIPARSIWENRRPTPVGQWPRIKEKRKTRERGKNRRDDLQVKKIKKKKIVQEGLRVKNNIRAG